MMRTKTLLLSGLLLVGGLAAAVPAPLPSGKAPLQNSSSGKIYSGNAVFDSKNLQWNYGSKQLKFYPDGTFAVLSNGRRLVSAYFFIATPYKFWQTNQKGFKKAGKYAGKRIEVRDIRTEKDKLIFSGLVPWQKQGEAAIPGKWELIVTALGKGRFSFLYTYDIPEGQKHRDCGIFMNVANIREVDTGDEGIWNPAGDENLSSFDESVLKFNANVPEDNFRIECQSWRTQQKTMRFPFRFGKNKEIPSFVLDLGESRVKKTEKSPGGVDLMAADALDVPKRGRNLMPNPYFAARSQFLYSGRNTASVDRDLFDTDAKFGRYSLNFGDWAWSASIPLDAGNYVFSFYAKGKGNLGILFHSAGGASKRFKRQFTRVINSPNSWRRYQVPFKFTMNNALATELRIPKGVKLDGLQLEKGSKATAFEAPDAEAAAIGEFFFESGKPVRLKFELSTLKKEVSGTGTMTIRNFFGEEVFRKDFGYQLNAGKYPELGFELGKLPDGIYIVKLDYGEKIPVQYFRFAVMPFLKNKHKTARVFSPGYDGHWFLTNSVSERQLARYQKIGLGTRGHGHQVSKEVMDTYAKYNMIPFDIQHCDHGGSEKMKQLFPELKNVPPGRMWFFVMNKDKGLWMKDIGLLPDYRLVGGWSEEYKKKFQKLVADQVRKYPRRFAYNIGLEWGSQIKDDPHYIDLFMAYREAVKSVYPDAYVYDAGDCNMDLHGGIASYDRLLSKMEGRTKTDFAATHTYVKDIRQLYPNFRAFCEMLKKHKGYEKCRIAFPEGMHFYPYFIPAWDMQHICWMGEGWNGKGPMSYDLGWSEKLSAAYYARSWLVYLTEFDRVWCGTSSASNTGNVFLDTDLTPRAFQKIPNTLGVLLGNPKRYLGDFTFAPDTKCLIWEDEKGRPLAAVWNEDPVVNSGYKDAPKVRFDYRGAEYIDLMGALRKPEIDGVFSVTPFPLFIRGKAGDFGSFTKALSTAILDDPDKIPCKIIFQLKSEKELTLNLINPLARPLEGSLKMFGRVYRLNVPKIGEQNINIRLPREIRMDRMEKMLLPYECTIDGRTVKQDLELNCFAVRKFNGNWKDIPSIRLTNKTGKIKNFTEKDFSASYQLAWDAKKMYLRVTVKDDVFSPGSTPGYRWNYDVVQVYFDTRCSAMKTGKKAYDDDDYDYGLMPTADGKRCEAWRALSPDIQLTLGLGAPKNNALAPEIPAKFTRTADGYIYEAEFPADYLLPMKLQKGYNFAFGIYAADKDKGKGVEKGLSNVTLSGSDCYNKPHLWPIAVLTE